MEFREQHVMNNGVANLIQETVLYLGKPCSEEAYRCKPPGSTSLENPGLGELALTCSALWKLNQFISISPVFHACTRKMRKSPRLIVEIARPQYTLYGQGGQIC